MTSLRARDVAVARITVKPCFAVHKQKCVACRLAALDRFSCETARDRDLFVVEYAGARHELFDFGWVVGTQGGAECERVGRVIRFERPGG
jgi:hypothetical protein